ncbi:MAG: GNAT family N-acetyltransferase [Bacteroidales bacterium]|nr:GNAT family N-acetyltransferase [Bacteroidales bacterium]
MKQYLTGEKIKLRPATMQDREHIFLWLTKSNLTQEMMGPPNYPDSKIPTWKKFINDYRDYYFDGSPLNGQCFIIEHNGQEIGQINHNKIDTLSKTTDLDIWLSDRKHTGKGFGPDAINCLCNYLHKKYGCNKFVISPSGRNLRAIRSYEKAGFVMTDEKPEASEMDYNDNVILIKTIDI